MLDFQKRLTDYDLNASYALETGMLEGLTLRVGVDNLTDEDPPIYPSYVQANTDPSQSDVYGRRYHLNMTYRF